MDSLRAGILQVYRHLTTGTTKVSLTNETTYTEVTIDGVAYQIVAVVNNQGDQINPASDEDLYLAVTKTNDLLEDIRFLLQAIAED